jgi:hypothetical protein
MPRQELHHLPADARYTHLNSIRFSLRGFGKLDYETTPSAGQKVMAVMGAGSSECEFLEGRVSTGLWV